MNINKSKTYLLLALAWGCGSNDPQGEKVGQQGLHLTSEIPQSSDVVAIRFEFTPVSCEDGTPLAEPFGVDRELEPFTIPGGIEGLEDQPLDAESKHLFADAFQTLEPGCYDVRSTPVQDSGIPSNLCNAAWKDGVEVLAGETTEILLINQCHGRDPAAIDVIATLNHEPVIEDVTFEESKFVECGGTQVVCATVSDPDKDPIELVWELEPDAPATGGPTVIKHQVDEETGSVTECVEFNPLAPGRFPLTLSVYDQLWVDGSLVRIEDWLTSEGYPHESHAEYDFFFYVPHGSSELKKLTFSVKSATLPPADVLMLDTTLSGGTLSPEAQAVWLKDPSLTINIVDAHTWGSMTTAQFADYKAIILGDATCASDFSAAAANPLVWGPAVDGNVIIIGTDETFHLSQGGQALTEGAVAFALANPTKTGAVISTSCFYSSAAPLTPVPLLDGFGSFTAQGASCWNDAHIVAKHPALAGVTGSTLSNWSCSVHNGFDTWPASFSVLAIAKDYGSLYESGDDTVGMPYILARGDGLIREGCNNGTIGGAEECDDGGNVDGDGCDANCRLEICGNDILQAGEQCDDGNNENEDGCSAECVIEPCFL
ncbi:MAG TPA: DUF4215 domain-containing protein [Polyangiaceae bacterium]|nr:DUF4215 domain-containing protein [Polyangiaceae bacterium]